MQHSPGAHETLRLATLSCHLAYRHKRQSGPEGAGKQRSRPLGKPPKIPAVNRWDTSIPTPAWRLSLRAPTEWNSLSVCFPVSEKQTESKRLSSLTNH